MKKIVLAGFPSVKNLGDPVLFESTEYLIKDVLRNVPYPIVVERLDLLGGKVGLKQLTGKIINRLYDRIGDQKERQLRSHYAIKELIYGLLLREHFEKAVKGSVAVVVAGGGLIKFKYESCDYRLIMLIKIASKHNIPVYLNAVGIEGYSDSDLRCQELKKHLNSEVVKVITTRDDISLLNDKYVTNTRIKTTRVADSALWSDKVYGLTKNPKSETVGLGVVRGGIFYDNGIDFSEGELLELWVGIIRELDIRGIMWKIFTNGLEADSQFCDLLLKRLNKTEDKESLVEIPRSPSDLVRIISQFNKVLACRMHASIIAYSLNIPSVGLVWNDKIRMFGKLIGHPERFIDVGDFCPKLIVDTLLNAENGSSDEAFKSAYRQTTRNHLQAFLASIVDVPFTVAHSEKI